LPKVIKKTINLFFLQTAYADFIDNYFYNSRLEKKYEKFFFQKAEMLK